MKKYLLSMVFPVVSGFIFGQTCNPQYADSTFGAWPDTTTNFATAYVGIPYSQILDFKVPANAADIDPAYPGTIQSFRVASVDGLPHGFTYNCSESNCTYAGGSHGCAELVGTAVDSLVGLYNIEIKVNATVVLGFFPTTIPYTFKGYKLYIEEDLSVKVIDPIYVSVFPNPSSSEVTIVNAKQFDNYELYSVNGNLIQSARINSDEEKINIANLENGIYFIHVINGQNKSVHKIVKK